MAAMKTAAILTPSGPFDDVGDRGVDEDQRDDTEGDGQPALPRAAGGEGDRDRGGGDQDQDAGGVGAALGVDVGVEDDGDRERAEGEDQHQGPYGPGPVRGHAVAGQVAGTRLSRPAIAEAPANHKIAMVDAS